MTVIPTNTADERGLDAILAVKPVWRALRRASEAIGLPSATLLHAGPAFASPRAITAPIRNSACVAAVFEGLAEDLEAAAKAIDNGGIRLQPAQDFGVVTPLAAVVSASMWLHEVVDADNPSRKAYAPINGGSGPAMRLGVCNDEVVAHIRWLNGPLADALAAAQSGDVDLIALARHGLEKGDDCHGRTQASTAELTRGLAPAIDSSEAARRFLDDGPSFFLNLWMAACKCMLSAANGLDECCLVTAAGGNGAESGIQIAAAPGHWYTAPAKPPHGALGDRPIERALGAIGDSAIVDIAGFGAMAMSYSPAQQEALGRFMPDDGLALPAHLLKREHPGFGALRVRVGLLASDVVSAGRGPVVALGILDKKGEAGRLGGGIYDMPLEPFAAAAGAVAGAAD